LEEAKKKVESGVRQIEELLGKAEILERSNSELQSRIAL
jgi:hypothetical protein